MKYLFQLLTDEDFKKIRLREAARLIDPKAGKKRKRGADNTAPAERYGCLFQPNEDR